MESLEQRACDHLPSPRRDDQSTSQKPEVTSEAGSSDGPGHNSASLWQALKNCVGKDLSRICLPVHFNEPLSFLQRLAEDVEYSELLDAAAVTPDATTRAALIGAYVVSHYSSTYGRTAKPFNPLLGETFDYVSHERGIALVAEQVCHHPPTSAIHVAGNGWTYRTSHEIRNKFHGNSLDVWPEGKVHIHLWSHGEHYVYEQARTTVHNIVVGSLWLENSGTITIQELNAGNVTITLRFKRYGLLFGEGKTLGEIDGKVIHTTRLVTSSGSGKSHANILKLSGNWRQSIYCDGKELWRCKPRPLSHTTAGHNMTSWGWELNAPGCPSQYRLPRTDSRLRPDQRALERRNYRLATEEKRRLEQQQRQLCQQREEQGESHQPRWFERRRGDDGLKEWHFNHKYFDCKANGKWPDDLPEIF